jgi:hypothetical protein
MIANTRSGQLVSKLQSTVHMYVSHQHLRDPSRKRRVARVFAECCKLCSAHQGNQLDVCFLASSISSRLLPVAALLPVSTHCRPRWTSAYREYESRARFTWPERARRDRLILQSATRALTERGMLPYVVYRVEPIGRRSTMRQSTSLAR